jgi:signal peptidase I
MINDITPQRKFGEGEVKLPPDIAVTKKSSNAQIPVETVVTNSSSSSDSNNPKGPAVKSAWKELISTVGILATALVVALLMIAFVFRSYQVDGPSMENTLQNSDKLIIWKVPRTLADLTGHPYIPHRGDIIVFTESGLSQFGQTNTKQLIKRVIGLPGDRVVVSNGVYTIYNKAHPNGFDPDKTLSYFHGIQIPVTSGTINVTLGPDQIFVSGDNRPDSLDSRAFGPINTKQIVGKLVLRVFPINEAKIF